MSRPEKSLHFLIKNPTASLHILINPEYRLQFLYLRVMVKAEVGSAAVQPIRK